MNRSTVEEDFVFGEAWVRNQYNIVGGFSNLEFLPTTHPSHPYQRSSGTVLARLELALTQVLSLKLQDGSHISPSEAVIPGCHCTDLDKGNTME